MKRSPKKPGRYSGAIVPENDSRIFLGLDEVRLLEDFWKTSGGLLEECFS
jgi:hypothetical protein